MNKALDSSSPEVTGMAFADAGGTAPLSDAAGAASGPAANIAETRRKALMGAARVAPRLTARLLARRYLTSTACLDRDRACGDGKAEFLPSGDAAAVLRHPGAGRAHRAAHPAGAWP